MCLLVLVSFTHCILFYCSLFIPLEAFALGGFATLLLLLCFPVGLTDYILQLQVTAL